MAKKKTTAKKVARKYGWKPDTPDQRDILYASILKKKRKLTLPSKVDLRANCSGIENQGNLGSCTAQAAVGCMEYLDIITLPPLNNLSRLFLYYNTRVIEGTVSWDAGATLRNTIKSLTLTGICRETLWPYLVTKFAVKPGSSCYTDANIHKVTAYARLLTLSEMQTCLAAGIPFVFGMGVYESFESDVVTNTGVIPMPGATEVLLGGHAMAAVGYDMTTKRFIARNSWGTNWGMAGYCTIPFAYLEDRNLSDDFWVVSKFAF